ncbi:glutamate receptor ionotropic, delta-2-like [Argiope bruennichi]|uniref:glutamate receptor ionotropic, delta-2-like n=1 Tax=Argiope bruennichi TaxID=94029 RepID=UPI0024944804|nr:glutamate receptor ionotropic, delta-2-like [Argiope bruennichi]
MTFPNFLKIAVVPTSGLFKVEVTETNETKVVGGTEKTFLELLSEVLKFEYEIIVPPDGDWGIYENGKWSGVIGKVYYGEADIGIGKISITDQRKKVVDYSYPYDVEDLTFATAIPKYLPKTTAFIAPFDTYIWGTLLITTIIFLIAFRFCQKKKRSFQRIVLKFVGYLLLQPLDVEPASKRSSLLVVTWLLTARFLSFFYSAALLAFLTIPQEENSVRTIPQLSEAIKNGKIQSMTIKGASYTSTLLKNEQEMIKSNSSYCSEKRFLLRAKTGQDDSENLFCGYLYKVAG